MITVAYICADPGVPVFGTKGASVHVQEIIRAWRTRGATVRIYCTRLGDDRPADLADVEVVQEPVAKPDRRLDITAHTAAREQAQREAAGRLAVRAIADGVDVVYERYSLFSTAIAQIHAATGVPGILEVNSPLIEEQQQHRHLVDEAGARDALRQQLAAAERVAAVSEPVAAWVREQAPDTDVIVAPNGVNVRRITPVTPGPEPVVLFIGTLKPWHGTDDLIRAAGLATQPWQLRIIGDGPEASRVREQAEQLGVPVDFRGALPPAEVPAAMAGARVAVAPYPDVTDRDQYFSPLKVYEYAAAGLPVVASDVGQIPDVVITGETGTLVPPSDPRSLAQAIDELLADPEQAAALGRRGRELMLEQHTWDQVLTRVLGADLPVRLDQPRLDQPRLAPSTQHAS